MKRIFNLLENMRSMSGNAQISYLNRVKSDILRDILLYTYDTNKKYKIDEKKFNKFYQNKCTERIFSEADWKVFKYTILDHLADIKSAKDEDIKDVCEYFNNFDEESQNFLKMILFKDLRLGLNRKKIQKVWPDFCVTYAYMGCKPFNMENLRNVPYPAYAQTKMDGSFCNIIVDKENNKVEYVSRQSKPQKIEGSLDELLLKLDLPEKFVFTGEILVWDEKTDKPLERKLSNGIIRRDEKTTEEIEAIRFICWDCLPYKYFIEKKWDKPYSERLRLLCDYFSVIPSPRLRVVDTWTVNTVNEALEIFSEQYEKGEEGIVVKSVNQIWQDGKPSGQVKIKAEKDCELRMIAFQEGKGLYSGKCGNILCESEDHKLEVFVKPRTFKDAELIWENQEKYLNQILTVKFNEVILSETKEKPSLYLPVFLEIRDDKKEADTFEYIQNL